VAKRPWLAIQESRFADRLKKNVGTSSASSGVTKDMIEARQGYAFESFTEKRRYCAHQGLQRTSKTNMGKREDYFEVGKPRGEDSDLAAEFEKSQRGDSRCR